MTKAAWTPEVRSAVLGSDPATRDMTAMLVAVPAAPKTCCEEPSSADPWACRECGSDPRPAVKSGVKSSASERLSSTCRTSTVHMPTCGSSTAKSVSDRVMPTAPGTTSGRAPMRS